MDEIKCIICKKRITGASALVRMSTRGRVFDAEFADQVDDAHDQGWFEIGPECIKKVRKAGAEGFCK